MRSVKIHKRAQAIFYDDNHMNFVGVNPRGTVPSIRTVHCIEPLTLEQLEEAAAMARSTSTFAAETVADVAPDPSPPAPTLFFFFDFDDTLSLRNGIEAEVASDAMLSQLFGDQARQMALATLLGMLLAEGRCFVLTANHGYTVVAGLLNLLLARCRAPAAATSAPHGTPTYFVLNETIQFTPTGCKVRAIQKVVEARGFRLAASFG